MFTFRKIKILMKMCLPCDIATQRQQISQLLRFTLSIEVKYRGLRWPALLCLASIVVLINTCCFAEV